MILHRDVDVAGDGTMKKRTAPALGLVLAPVLVLVLLSALAADATAFDIRDTARDLVGLDDPVTKKVTLHHLNSKLKKYEGGKFDPGSVKYKTYGDKDFDRISKRAAKIRLAVDFAEKVSKSNSAKRSDYDAAIDALEDMSKQSSKLTSNVSSFGKKATKDAKKAVLVTESKSILKNVNSATKKAPKILKTLRKKAKAKAKR
ncbi:hypothetical protein KDL45_06135 [bacterium]|nr:hypothetical protein [bacterium]